VNTAAGRPARRWPLLLLALPAGVATWSGWVGLGELTGFGPVKPLPGISDFTINTAITLPIGVETYAAYALGAWLSHSSRISDGTRGFAKWSAFGALLLGMLGQVAYHLLVTFDLKVTPWEIVTAVSCLPVLVLGMGAGLGHLLARDSHAVTVEPAAAVEVLSGYVPEPPAAPRVPVSQEVYDWAAERDAFPPDAAPTPPVVVDIPAVVPVAAPELEAEPETVEYVPGETSSALLHQAANRFFYEIAGGKVPGVRQLKAELAIGQDKAQQVRAYLSRLATQ
jgi:hypothetical protein